ncbi:MAG: hypothetical protein LBP83_09365 [Dysgonamonadaceae bacterium]|jgi:hypothetical protein|nr:hypothetical protein [Dysgonamonadaceae bacterium]
MIFRQHHRFIFFILLFALSSCEPDPEILPVLPEPVLPQRTIIAYLCGDNNLSSEVGEKLDALKQGMNRAGETDNTLIVYTDCRNEMPKLLQVSANEIRTLAEYAEINSASGANLSRIFQKIMQDFPAQGYGLICFSHASGWLPKGALNNPGGFAGVYPPDNAPALRSIFEDEAQEMPLSEFASAIPLTPSGDKLDFILFEMCYMAGVEVAYELRHKAKYIVSSATEMLSTGFVEIYPEHLAGLFAPIPSLKTFAQAYFNTWNSKTGTSCSASISVINTEKTEELAKALKPILAENKTVDITGIQHFNRNPYHLFFDLSDYVQTLATPEQKTGFDQALSQVIEYQAATLQFMQGYPYAFTIHSHCGLTTYIEQEQFPDLNKEYAKTAWAKAIVY